MVNRIHSIDSMRILAMVFVVAIHTDPFRGLGVYGNAINFLIDSTGRFAVPFFFVTSGYFFARKTARRDPTDYVVDRVATISSIYAFGLLLAVPAFLAGTVIRASVENRDVANSGVRKLTEFFSPVELLYYGNSVSEILWFLPALAFSLAFIYVFIVLDRTRYLLPISLALHGIGLLGASYTMFVDVPFEIRDALFFGLFYTALGYRLSSRGWRPGGGRSTRYLGATVLFGALHLGERYVLGYVVADESIAQSVYAASYTITTALLTISLFAFLLSRPNLGRSTPLPSWGKYAVGVYVVHPTVLFVLELGGEVLDMVGYGVTNTLSWHLFLTPATFVASLLLYVAAQRRGVVEMGGSHLPRISRIRNRNSKS